MCNCHGPAWAGPHSANACSGEQLGLMVLVSNSCSQPAWSFVVRLFCHLLFLFVVSICCFIHWFMHSLTHSLTPATSYYHSITHSLARSLTHSLTHSFSFSFVLSINHFNSFICSFIHSFICSFMHPFIHLFMHAFLTAFMQLFPFKCSCWLRNDLCRRSLPDRTPCCQPPVADPLLPPPCC